MKEFDVSSLCGRVIVITGHFGCGKTNIAVNLAERAVSRSETYLIDFDNVNPYFRSADSKRELEALGVRAVVPEFANTNVDIPAVSPLVYSAISAVHDGATVMIDVGGDMLGAVSVGSLKERIISLPHTVVYVFSAYRPLTDTPEKAFAVLKEIEKASGLTADFLIDNSNIGAETSVEDVESSSDYSDELCRLSGLPLLFTSYMTDLPPKVRGDILKLENKTKKLF